MKKPNQSYLDICRSIYFYDRSTINLDGIKMNKKHLIININEENYTRSITADLTAVIDVELIPVLKRWHDYNRGVVEFEVEYFMDQYIVINANFYLSPSNCNKFKQYADFVNNNMPVSTANRCLNL